MTFDAQAAKQAGYSDGEIADYLGQQSKFDVAGARKAGYSDGEIIQQLSAPRAAPKAAPKVNTAVDVGKSALTGLGDLVSSGVNIASNVFPGAGFGMKAGAAVSNMANRALHLPQLFDNSSPQDIVNSARAPTPARPSATPASDVTSGNLYQPQTTAGKYARTAVQFAPAAFMPGSVAAKAANVFVPAVASETAGQVAQHFGASPEVENAARMVGAIGGGVAAATRINPGAITAKAPVASLDTLESAKNAAYKAVDESGVKFTPQAFDGLTQDMAKSMDEQGFNAGLHPKAAAMISKIAEGQKQTGGHSPTLTQLDQLRQQIGRDVASAPDAGDRRMGQIMRDSIDNFINSAGQEHLAEGSPEGAAQMIAKARDLNTRVAKLKSLDNLDEAATDRAAATGSGGNGENALRQNVIRFQNKTGNLTPDEQAAAQTAIRGTPAGNIFRQVGKLSPQGNGLMLGGQLAAAVPTHGASGLVALAGAASKIVSKAMTERNVQNLRDLIASGGSKAEVAAARAAVLKSQPPLIRLQNPLQTGQSGNMFSPREAVAR